MKFWNKIIPIKILVLLCHSFFQCQPLREASLPQNGYIFKLLHFSDITYLIRCHFLWKIMIWLHVGKTSQFTHSYFGAMSQFMDISRHNIGKAPKPFMRPCKQAKMLLQTFSYAHTDSHLDYFFLEITSLCYLCNCTSKRGNFVFHLISSSLTFGKVNMVLHL